MNGAPRSRSPWLSRLPFLVPPLYLALVFGLQPADRLGEPDTDPRLGRLLYDDYDVTAMALRGLNASRGRTAGRPDEPSYPDLENFRAALDRPAPPAPRYFLEYPHAAVALFRLPFDLLPACAALEMPPAVLDGVQNVMVWHRPRDEAERRVWHCFRRA